MSAQPFKINVSELALTDLRERLAATRWPAAVPGAGWHYGRRDGVDPPARRPLAVRI